MTTLLLSLLLAGEPVELFNGKNLSGWRPVQGKASAFKVEDGAIVGDRSGGGAYWLSTEKKYGDFELSLEYRLSPGGNSGVFIRVPHHKPRTSVQGMEVQLLDDLGDGKEPDKGATGAIYRVKAADRKPPQAKGEWNRVRIVARGDTIEIHINGALVNTVDMSKYPDLDKRPRAGFIGLSAHTEPVRFRNVTLHELAP